jgi:hypothetical protein
MIFEPAPTSPRSPVRRGLWLAGLALPPVMLAGVIAAGILGSRPEPQPATPAPTAAALVAEPPSPVPTTAAPEPAGADQALDGVFPYAFEALAVRGPSALIIARAAGHPFGVAAVAGYLSIGTPDVVCAARAPEPPGPWCEREGIIAERSWSRSTGGSGGMPSHLHVTIPIGVRLPAEVERASLVGGGPIPVVAIGRFAPDSPCRPGGSRCDIGFVVERVGWSNGDWLDVTPLVETRLGEAARRPDPFRAAVGDGDVPLLAVLARPDTIALLDPATRAATISEARPLWYVRLAAGAAAGNRWQPLGARVDEPSVRWVLLDESQSGVIATGVARAAIQPVGQTVRAPGIRQQGGL